MKKIIMRILIVVLIAAMLTSMLAGCKRAPASNYVPPEFVFVPEIFPLPNTISDISNLIYSNDTLFFVSNVRLPDTWITEAKLFSMNLDGSNLAELTAFKPLSHPNPDATGWVRLDSMSIDSDGNLWVLESGDFYIENLPDDFSGYEWEKDQYREHIGSLSELRKLDKSGTQILSIDVNMFAPPRSDYFRVNSSSIDGAGNIYLAVSSYNDEGDSNEVVILGSDGNVIQRIKYNGWIERFINLSNGSVAVSGWGEGPDGSWGQQTLKIDLATGTAEEPLELPERAWQTFPGSGEYMLLYLEGSDNLYGVKESTGESVRLVNWIESNILPDSVSNVMMLPDGRVLLTNQKWRDIPGSWETEITFEIIIMTKTPYSQIPERIVLTLATVSPWNLRRAIVDFNQTNQRYRIHMLDYSEWDYETGRNTGIDRLTTDLIAGNIPDILDLTGLPFYRYAARGLLEDLYPLIDSDSELNRSDFIESVLNEAEVDGKLFRLFSSFSINTIVGNPTVIGYNMGWNMDEFRATLDAHPQADMPMGQWLTRENFLEASVLLSLDEYIDWTRGTASFDAGGFAQLLEFSNRFPPTPDPDAPWDEDFQWFSPDELIATGRQIMAQAQVGGFTDLQYYWRLFGGELVFKGIPTQSGNGNSLSLGNSLAITTNTVDKNGAWEFIRIFLTPEWQRENITWQFPMNKEILDERIVTAMTANPEYKDDIPGNWGRSVIVYDAPVRMPTMPGMPGMDGPMVQEQIDQILDLINSARGIVDYDSPIMEIIREDTSNYFNGRQSAQDTARIIQSRVSRFVSEQS